MSRVKYSGGFKEQVVLEVIDRPFDYGFEHLPTTRPENDLV